MGDPPLCVGTYCLSSGLVQGQERFQGEGTDKDLGHKHTLSVHIQAPDIQSHCGQPGETPPAPLPTKSHDFLSWYHSAPGSQAIPCTLAEAFHLFSSLPLKGLK